MSLPLGFGKVGLHELSPLQDRTLVEVTETARMHKTPAVNKGGTALMTPFADESRQRAFLLSGIGPLDGMEEGHSREPGRRRSAERRSL